MGAGQIPLPYERVTKQSGTYTCNSFFRVVYCLLHISTYKKRPQVTLPWRSFFVPGPIFYQPVAAGS
jgi:hypothetical protein